jgi:hypothetical protein
MSGCPQKKLRENGLRGTIFLRHPILPYLTNATDAIEFIRKSGIDCPSHGAKKGHG